MKLAHAISWKRSAADKRHPPVSAATMWVVCRGAAPLAHTRHRALADHVAGLLVPCEYCRRHSIVVEASDRPECECGRVRAAEDDAGYRLPEGASHWTRAAHLWAWFDGVSVIDLRSIGTLPELPEVLAQTGQCAVYRMPSPDGRTKVGIIGAGLGSVPGPGPIEAFLRGWGASQGLTDVYGDPARGFAGGYLAGGAS